MATVTTLPQLLQFDSYPASAELPTLVKLERNLVAAAFRLMKLFPARYILDQAERNGELRPGTTVIESTSGSFGLALAMLCNLRGYDLILICDGDIEPMLRRRIEDLGARVLIPDGSNLQAGAQAIRLARLAIVQQEIPNHFTPGQYDNPLNRRGYWQLADLLAAELGQLDCLVATVGTGGSACGTAERLRAAFPDLALVGVDTPGSMLFGHGDEPRLIKGLGSSILPRNVRHSLFDEVHWVDAATAFRATRELHQRHALYMGPTSGAAVLVAQWYARVHPDSRVLIFLPDEGYRYEASVYSDSWLRENAWVEVLPTHPVEIDHPRDVSGPWCRLPWMRRELRQFGNSVSLQEDASRAVA